MDLMRWRGHTVRRPKLTVPTNLQTEIVDAAIVWVVYSDARGCIGAVEGAVKRLQQQSSFVTLSSS